MKILYFIILIREILKVNSFQFRNIFSCNLLNNGNTSSRIPINQHYLSSLQNVINHSYDTEYPHSRFTSITSKLKLPLSISSEINNNEEIREKKIEIRMNLLMFLYFITIGSIVPFQSIYYKSKGLSASTIGLLSSITPMLTGLCAPLWGIFIDSSEKSMRQRILILTFLGSVIARCLLVLNISNIPLLVLVVAITAILNAPVRPMIDNAVLSRLQDKSAYGKTRSFGQIGFGIGSYLGSVALSISTNFIFLINAILSLPALILMIAFDPHIDDKSTIVDEHTEKNKNESKSISKANIYDVMKIAIQDKKILLFLLLVLVIGINSGIVDTFAYTYLNQLGAKQTLGISRLCSSLVGVPMFYLSGEIIKKIGVLGIYSISLMSYILRFFTYSIISDPMYAFPAEITRGPTFATFWAASTYFMYKVAPSNMSTTMLGVLNGLYNGVAQTIGSIVGGYLVHSYGMKTAFRICAIINTIILGCFGIPLIHNFIKSLQKTKELKAVI